MEETNALITALSGTSGVAGGVGVAWLLLRAYISAQANELRDLRNRFADLSGKELGAVVQRVEKIEARCVSHREAQDVAKLQVSSDAVTTALMRIENKVDGVREDVAAVKATIDNHKGWISDVRDEIRMHKADHVAHGGNGRG